MAEALRALKLPSRKPTPADGPEPGKSKFPMTPGAREAMRITRENNRLMEGDL